MLKKVLVGHLLNINIQVAIFKFHRLGYAFDTSPLQEFWEILGKCVFGLQKEVYNF
jgi:hypothetical protein